MTSTSQIVAGSLPLSLSANKAELNLRILASLGLYVRDHFGAAALEEVAEAGGLTSADLGGNTRWVSLEHFEAVLSAARVKMRTDAEFQDACAYMYRERALGLMRYLPWASGLVNGYERGCKSIKLISRISHWEMDRNGRTLVFRYRSDRKEGKLMCLSRQAQLAAFPTMWDLPKAQVHECGCLADGAPHCEYVVKTFEHRHWLPSAIGFAMGLAVVALSRLPGVPVPIQWASLGLPLIGFLVGQYVDMQRTIKVNAAAERDISEEYTKLAAEEGEARSELLDLHQRQRHWSHAMEEQVADRTKMLHKVMEGIQRLQEQRVYTLRGFSHDLRNPLTMLRCGVELLAEAQTPAETRSLLEEMRDSVGRMNRLLVELMESASADAGLLQIIPQKTEVKPLVGALHRRLRALVHGRDIRASVFSSREAPDFIEIDPLLLDRVIDNLFTNAVKYTARGSILVEVTGTPGFLTLKVSDTGRGITQESIEQIFERGQSDARSRAPNSYGVGLSVVVQLMDQIGGKIEVMSKPDVGTTFWAHFPVTPRIREQTQSSPQRLETGSAVDRVVTIRRADGA